jgi:hypothetical protein
LIASMATCALNAALCFFLVVFIRVKLIILLNLPSGLNLREYYRYKSERKQKRRGICKSF